VVGADEQKTVTVYGITGREISDIGGAGIFENGVVGRAHRYVIGIDVGAGAWARGITGNLLSDYARTFI